MPSVAPMRDQRGYSLIELLVVMLILGTILAGLGGLFVSAMYAEADLSRRFQAETEVRLALDKVRREGHCARSAQLAPDSSYVLLDVPASCPTAGGADVSVMWCVRSNGTPSPRYALFRIAPSTGSCAGGVRQADYLTSGAPFGYTAPVSGSSRPKVSVDFTVDLTPTDTVGRYALKDDIVLRNSIL